MSSTISFGRTPAEAIEYFEKKGLKLTWDYDEMMYEAHHKAFTVAKVTKLDLLKDIQSSLSQAMKEGQNYKDWHKNIKPTLQKHGWYGKTEVFNPDTGEFKTITVGSKRLKNIFDTNMRVSYARASYKQQMGFKLAVFWRYNSMLLETTRASHRSRHGIVLPREHVWWDINYPPNDWNCKCFVTAHTAKEVEKKGWSIHAGELDSIAGKDWAYNVGRNDNIGSVWDNKIDILSMPKKDETKEIKYLRSKIAAHAKEEKHLTDLFMQAIENAPTTLKTYMVTNVPKIIKDERTDVVSYYNAATKTITITKTKQDLLSIIRHEIGHYIDDINSWFSDDIIKTLSLEQIALLQNKNKQEILDMLRDADDIAIQDIFYINTKGKVSAWQTRADDFDFANKNTIARETFANILEMIVSGDDRIDIIRKYFPITVDKIDKLLKEL